MELLPVNSFINPVEIGITVAHLKWNVRSMVGSHIIGAGLTPKRKHGAIAKKPKSASQKRQKHQKLQKVSF